MTSGVNSGQEVPLACSLEKRWPDSSRMVAHPECMVRRLDASEKEKDGVGLRKCIRPSFGEKRLRARMECATLSSHLVMQSWKASSGCGFGERRV